MHFVVLERFEREPGETRQARPPGGPPLEQLGAREGDDENRRAARPAEHRLDELDRSCVSPMQILENHHGWCVIGDRLEEAAPRCFSLPRSNASCGPETKQDLERRQHPVPVGRIDELIDSLGQLVALGVVIVGVGDLRPGANHLAKSPERHPLAVGRRTPAMPIGRIDQSVEILLQLVH